MIQLEYLWNAKLVRDRPYPASPPSSGRLDRSTRGSYNEAREYPHTSGTNNPGRNPNSREPYPVRHRNSNRIVVGRRSTSPRPEPSRRGSYTTSKSSSSMGKSSNAARLVIVAISRQLRPYNPTPSLATSAPPPYCPFVSP